MRTRAQHAVSAGAPPLSLWSRHGRRWAEASGGLDLSVGETPAFSGKALVALRSLGAEARAHPDPSRIPSHLP